MAIVKESVTRVRLPGRHCRTVKVVFAEEARALWFLGSRSVHFHCRREKAVQFRAQMVVVAFVVEVKSMKDHLIVFCLVTKGK